MAGELHRSKLQRRLDMGRLAVCVPERHHMGRHPVCHPGRSRFDL
jgi:hypothetical protein